MDIKEKNELISKSIIKLQESKDKFEKFLLNQN